MTGWMGFATGRQTTKRRKGEGTTVERGRARCTHPQPLFHTNLPSATPSLRLSPSRVPLCMTHHYMYDSSLSVSLRPKYLGGCTEVVNDSNTFPSFLLPPSNGSHTYVSRSRGKSNPIQRQVRFTYTYSFTLDVKLSNVRVT